MNYRFVCIALLAFTASLFVSTSAAAQDTQAAKEAAQAAKEVPSIDGGLGPCTADFTVNDPSNAPVYDAKIKVRIKYGFGNFHKLDLELGTNADGKARVTGLPDKLNHGLYFHATKGDLAGEVF